MPCASKAPSPAPPGRRTCPAATSGGHRRAGTRASASGMGGGNRAQGTGTRLLLDDLLAEADMTPSPVQVSKPGDHRTPPSRKPLPAARPMRAWELRRPRAKKAWALCLCDTGALSPGLPEIRTADGASASPAQEIAGAINGKPCRTSCRVAAANAPRSGKVLPLRALLPRWPYRNEKRRKNSSLSR